MVTPLQEQIELLIGPITQDEFWTAVPKAHAKLWRIVEREGNPDGKRLTVDSRTDRSGQNDKEDSVWILEEHN